MRLTPIAAVVATAVIAIACASGGNNNSRSENDSADTTTAEAAADDGIPEGDLGDTLTVNTLTGKPAAEITVSDLKTGVTSSNTLVEAKAGTFTTIHVEGTFFETIVFGPSSFAIVDADGRVIKSKALVPGVDGQVEFGTYRDGQSTGGIVVFDVDPDRLDGARIEYGTIELLGVWNL